MENHFHLVLETPQANLVAGMKWFLGTYTARFNRRHRLFSHLFSGRYKSLIVDGSGHGYLRTVCDYVHLNPVRAKLLIADQTLRDYPWSIYGTYLKPPSERPGWLRVDRLLGELNMPKASAAGRRQFEQRMEERRAQEAGGEWQALRRGWCLGDDEFRQELLAQAHEQTGRNHYGRQRRETAEEKAGRLVGEKLAGHGWKVQELTRRPKGDAEKVQIALRLRRETSVTQKWIARRLRMGSWTYVSNLLAAEQRERSGNSEDPFPQLCVRRSSFVPSR